MRYWLEAAFCQSELQRQAAARDCMHSSVRIKTDQVFYLELLAVERVPSEAIRLLAQVSAVLICQLMRQFKLYLFLFAFNSTAVGSCHLPIGGVKTGFNKGGYSVAY